MCASDVLAFGVLSECKKLKLDVPGQITVSGFDNQDFSALTEPPLTTIDVPAGEMGVRSAEALLSAMSAHRGISSVQLDTSLIVRASTANAPVK
jgi:LacI family transcriptional regulator